MYINTNTKHHIQPNHTLLAPAPIGYNITNIPSPSPHANLREICGNLPIPHTIDSQLKPQTRTQHTHLHRKMQSLILRILTIPPLPV